MPPVQTCTHTGPHPPHRLCFCEFQLWPCYGRAVWLKVTLWEYLIRLSLHTAALLGGARQKWRVGKVA